LDDVGLRIGGGCGVVLEDLQSKLPDTTRLIDRSSVVGQHRLLAGRTSLCDHASVAGIFISYRRADTGGFAGRLSSDLIARLGRDRVFIDIDSIGPGADFGVRIREALLAADVTVVLIGESWLGPSEGGRRIDEVSDYVHLEVAGAIAHDPASVVPVLVEGARMPAFETLPQDLASLARLNALPLTNSHWAYDVNRLVELVELRSHVSPGRRLFRRFRRDRWLQTALVLGAVLVVSITIVFLTKSAGNQIVDPAQRIQACETAHSMSAQEVRRAPQPGETAIPASELVDASQISFATCSWPPAVGADDDGYRSIAITSVANPDGGSEATGDDGIDRIESTCRELELSYSFGSQGDFQDLPPFQPLPSEVWKYNPDGDSSHAFALTNPIGHVIYPVPNEVQVFVSSRVLLDKATCLR
jgi:hypothetical protein